MSKASDALTARAARTAQRGSGATVPAASAAPAPVPRARPVRLTLDLAPVQHRELTRWCSAAADDLGLTKVPATAVLRLLVAQLVTDPDLAATVRALIPGELEQ